MQTIRIYLPVCTCGLHVDCMWKACVICAVALDLLKFSMGSTMGVKDDLIIVLAICSQIFEYLRGNFKRHDLEYLQSARSERKKLKKNALFLRKRLTVVDLFEGLWSVDTRLGH